MRVFVAHVPAVWMLADAITSSSPFDRHLVIIVAVAMATVEVPLFLVLMRRFCEESPAFPSSCSMDVGCASGRIHSALQQCSEPIDIQGLQQPPI
jgi:hypothetical protein